MGEKEYNYNYEDGRLVRATENDITLSGEIVTAKTVIHTICYYYDSEGQMTRKHILPAEGTAQAIYYETSEDNTAVKFYAGGQYVTSHSKSDEFGRKVFDELQLGTGFLSRQFSYHTGEATEEHIENKKLKSSPTTQLVSHIALSDGRTLSYEYDEEERITKVTETFQGENVTFTEYTYDSLGQLLAETVNGEVVNTMTYDNYGNIVSKNGVVYTYGDEHWKDLLTGYGDKTITYDTQGNPINYLDNTLTWEKGRQLKKLVKADGTVIDYTYNANGIRTSKTVNGVKHTYTLDGTKILSETWTKDGVNHSIVPMYDNEDSVCGIQYNGEPFYFQKNLQGDIIAIVDKGANTVERYSYDAWGVCTITEDVSGCGIAEVNPYRYRGYYFDSEIEMYYLQSRYYNPVTGQFLNADDVKILRIKKDVLNTNLFTYCENEPVCNFDPYGYLVITIGVSIGFVVLAGVSLFAMVLVDSTLDFGIFIGATLLFGLAVEGSAGSVGIYWGFRKIKDYLNAVTVGFAAGYGKGGAIIYHYYRYPYSGKKVVGIQIMKGITGFYRETAPIDGGIYIPLKSKLAEIFKGCGTNYSKLKKKAKSLKIKVG